MQLVVRVPLQMLFTLNCPHRGSLHSVVVHNKFAMLYSIYCQTRIFYLPLFHTTLNYALGNGFGQGAVEGYTTITGKILSFYQSKEWSMPANPFVEQLLYKLFILCSVYRMRNSLPKLRGTNLWILHSMSAVKVQRSHPHRENQSHQGLAHVESCQKSNGIFHKVFSLVVAGAIKLSPYKDN